MGAKLSITLTVNYASGLEIEIDEIAAPSLAEVSAVVEDEIRSLRDSNYSSLVIVVVPFAGSDKPAQTPARRLELVK